jgi:ABC-2 type transport system permease protein
MRKLKASIQKEFALVLNDKVGLLLMYLMPVILVFLITVIQNSAFDLVKENKLKILVSNNDHGRYGDSLIAGMIHSGNFEIIEKKLSSKSVKNATLSEKAMAGLYIPSNYSAVIQANASAISSSLLSDMGMMDSTTKNYETPQPLDLYFDPIIQTNYRYTVQNGMYQLHEALENKVMLGQLFSDLGYSEIPPKVKEAMIANKTTIRTSNAQIKGTTSLIPNATQHNVPAWSIFAMFFMVISLGGNLVKERNSGSFVRLQTIPGAFKSTLVSKYVVYLFVGISQLTLLMFIGVTLLPYLGLPKLELPSSIAPLILVVILASSAAVSYAMLVGTYAKTQEQANGFGAVTIVIFAAIGGIWVPAFIMPPFMQNVGMLSPLKWCLEAFYMLFLKNGAWNDLLPSITFLFLFTGICQLLIIIKLRIQNYI